VIDSCKATCEYRPTYISERIQELLRYDPNRYLEDPRIWYNGLRPEDVMRITSEFKRLLE
jgi:(2Fe-2S) ferredoxin